jgi:hypothetical protein
LQMTNNHIKEIIVPALTKWNMFLKKLKLKLFKL